MRVYLVDDSLVIRQRLAKLLSSLNGVKIIGESREARDAADSIQRLRPDVVILDLQLLDGTGFSVLEEIKQKKPAPVVIMLTNFPYPQFRTWCMNAGADYFFDKSTEFRNIAMVFRELSQQTRGRKALDVKN